MMKKLAIPTLVPVLALAFTFGSVAPAHADKDTFGLIAGALGGGVIGNQFGKGKGNTWATAIGAVTGAVVGQSVGTSLDRADRAERRYYSGGSNSYYQPAPVYYNQPAPQRVYYVPSYEQRVRTYEVVPQPASYTVVDNSVSYGNYGTRTGYCREYNQRVTVGGRVQDSYGTACMQPDGSWQVQP